jgi:hypothetical protein
MVITGARTLANRFQRSCGAAEIVLSMFSMTTYTYYSYAILYNIKRYLKMPIITLTEGTRKSSTNLHRIIRSQLYTGAQKILNETVYNYRPIFNPV